ncbi:unnamed protein product [Oppiella nova]|uniref:Mitochondrial carrier protein n=1 Tax=Oppiella nova TaxID=334625 RepID=A0A7R9MCJ8_9ACAR|nr:unnamed protein product [Oppiella nova]CAG2174862.1 unnamed protein product [Oppiella nova]
MSANTSADIISAPVKRPVKWLSHVRYEHLVAGVVGGVVPTLVLHPFDLVKIRMAVNDGQVAVRPKYNGLVNTVTTIVKHEGLTGLYRGVTPNCVGSGASWGLHMMAAAIAGVITTSLTNPIWVVKTQMCLQYGTGSQLEALTANTKQTYSGMVAVMRRIYRTEGVPGLYRGYVPGILNVSHGALQFMAYEELKTLYVTSRGLDVTHLFSLRSLVNVLIANSLGK